MLPMLTLVAIAAAIMGMLNSLRHFFVPALSPAMFNVVTIVMAVGLVPFATPLGIDHPIAIIAVATVMGGVAQLALQWPTLRREGFRYQPVLDWKDPGLRRVLLLMGPGTVGLAATQLNLVVNVYLAAREGTGPVSWLEYAFRLMYLPIGLFGVSIATALLPDVTRRVITKDTKGSRDSVADALSLMLMLNVPAMVGLMVLAVPIVRVIFERGKFVPADTIATAAALQFYAIGLVGYSIVRIASPTFYALGKNRIPVIVSMFTVVVNAFLNIMLVREMGYVGLALGTSIAALFNAVTLLVLLHRNLGGLNEARILGSLARVVLASAAMGATAFFVDHQLAAALPGQAIPIQILRVTATIVAALGVLALSSWMLRIREFQEGMALVSRKFRRRRP
jgi:putative peptidoglycan lipid II flippase